MWRSCGAGDGARAAYGNEASQLHMGPATDGGGVCVGEMCGGVCEGVCEGVCGGVCVGECVWENVRGEVWGKSVGRVWESVWRRSVEEWCV